MLVWELYGKFQTLRSNLFKEISINLREEIDNFHRVQPHNERQKDLTKKHLMKGSTDPKVHKIEFTLRFMSLITRIISI